MVMPNFMSKFVMPLEVADRVARLGKRIRVALDDAHIGTEHLAFELIRRLPGFGVKYGDGHAGRFPYFPEIAVPACARTAVLKPYEQ